MKLCFFSFEKKNSSFIGNQIMQHVPMELSGDQVLEHEEKNHALLDIGHSINLCVHDPYKKVLESK